MITARSPRTLVHQRVDVPPPVTGQGEKDVLVGFLAYLRTSVVHKVDGAPEPDVRSLGVPSGTNLLGLVRHLAHVERFIFLGENVNSWSSTFHAPKELTVDSVLADYLAAIERVDAVIAECVELSAPVFRRHDAKQGPSMRWALVHMIEETGRHAGHIDILRELIDGRTGR